MPDDRAATPGEGYDWAAWAISVVNGAVGDYLCERGNGLAIDMAFYHRRRPLCLTRENLLRVHPCPTGKVCVSIHGLGCHEGIWTFQDPARPASSTSYGALLQAELGYTPFFVRYNTGLPLADNGRHLAALLAELVACYPVPIEEIVLIGHSMGGLIVRSACHEGARQQAGWVERVTQVFYLGTPHDGAPLAKFVRVATTMLQAVPTLTTRIIGDIIDRRSQGVKDLRFGARLDANDHVGGVEAGEKAVPWLANVEHYLISGTLTTDPQHAVAMLFGDGLVLPPRRRTQCNDGPIDPSSLIRDVVLFTRMHHFQLAHDPAVYQQIAQRCQSARKER